MLKAAPNDKPNIAAVGVGGKGWSDITETSKGGAKRNAIDQKVGDYYASCIDESAIEKRGLSAIRPELDRIAALKSKKDLAPLLAHIHLITGNLIPGGNSGATTAVFGYGSIPDFDNASMVVGAWPSSRC